MTTTTWKLCPRCGRRTTVLLEDEVLGDVCNRCATEAARAREGAEERSRVHEARPNEWGGHDHGTQHGLVRTTLEDGAHQLHAFAAARRGPGPLEWSATFHRATPRRVRDAALREALDTIGWTGGGGRW